MSLGLSIGETVSIQNTHSELNLVSKALWIVRHRPRQFFSHLRSYWLFSRTRWIWPCFGPGAASVQLGNNVRVQRLRTLLAEAPQAKIRIGNNSVIWEKARIEAYGRGSIEIGECSLLGDLRIAARQKVVIGKRFLSSWNVFIQDFDPHPTDPSLRAIQVENHAHSLAPHWGIRQRKTLDWEFPSAAIEIGDDVWIGANSTILKGSKIGSGCVIASGSVVTGGDFPSNSLIAGAPARLVKALE